MTYDEFLAKYNNTSVDFDHMYGAQCMDLVLFYAAELGLPGFWGNARDVATQEPPGWTRVAAPERGDVVVFAPNSGNEGYGHIGIFDRPGFIFSQNYWPSKLSCVQAILPGDTIIAILRPKGADVGISQEQYDKDIQGTVDNWKAATHKLQNALAAWVRLAGGVPDDGNHDKFLDKDPDDIVKMIEAEPGFSKKRSDAQQVLDKVKQDLSN